MIDRYKNAYLVVEYIELPSEFGNYFHKDEVMCVCETEEDAHKMTKFYTDKGIAGWKKDHFWDMLSFEYIINVVTFIGTGESAYYKLTNE